MMAGTVVGSIAATIRTASLQGLPLVVVQTGADPEANIVACNPLSAGKGDRVLVSRGAAARNALGETASSIDATVVAILDGDGT